MSEHYHDATDGQRLRDMRKLAPADFEAWLNLNKIIAREDGAIPRSLPELIAAAVACAIQCPYCIEAHAGAAKVAGASREGLVEAHAAGGGDSRRRGGDPRRDGAEVLRSEIARDRLPTAQHEEVISVRQFEAILLMRRGSAPPARFALRLCSLK